jgi:hypothetical protein
MTVGGSADLISGGTQTAKMGGTTLRIRGTIDRRQAEAAPTPGTHQNITRNTQRTAVLTSLG